MRGLWWGVAAVVLAGCGTSAPVPTKTESQVSSSTAALPGDDGQAVAEPAQTESVAIVPMPELKLEPVLAPLSPELQELDAAFLDLVRAAENNQPDAWATAEQKLQEAGGAIVPVLIRHLNDPSSLAREQAVMLLAQLGPDASAARKALEGLLDDDSIFARVNAAATYLLLTQIEAAHLSPDQVEQLSVLQQDVTKAVAALGGAIDSPSVELRATAISGLSMAGEAARPMIPRLVSALEDTEQPVRVAAVRALGELGGLGAAQISKIRQLMMDADEDVREAAEEAHAKLEGTVGDAIPAAGIAQ